MRVNRITTEDNVLAILDYIITWSMRGLAVFFAIVAPYCMTTIDPISTLLHILSYLVPN